MSRGFVKEDDQEETPMIPPRAHLPAGTPNYVTPNGLRQLQEEKAKLESELKDIDTSNERERRIAINFIHAKMELLEERLLSAQSIELKDQDIKEVRFGALVELKIGNANQTQIFQIVGVDEASLKEKKIAFTSPLAKKLMGKQKGEKVELKLEAGNRLFEIIAIQTSTN